MKEFAKRMARWAFGDYAIYWICAWPAPTLGLEAASPAPGVTVEPIDLARLDELAVPAMAGQAGYFGEGSQAYGCFDAGRLIGICFYWFGERYRTRNFWPLGPGEAKLVQILVLPQMRGRGAAVALIRASADDMAQRGFQRLYARIWHSNTPSLRAFVKAGWARTAVVVELNPLRRKDPWRWRWNM